MLQPSETIKVQRAVLCDLKALDATVDMHEQNKARLQDKLANPQLFDLKSLEHYKRLLHKTTLMIDCLQKDISKRIKQL